MSSQAIRTLQLEKQDSGSAHEYDRTILLLYLTLVAIGLVMVASASISVADQLTQDPFYYAKRQFLRILISLSLMWFAYKVPLEFWKNNGMALMLGSVILLACVLIPGLGIPSMVQPDGLTSGHLPFRYPRLRSFS